MEKKLNYKRLARLKSVQSELLKNHLVQHDVLHTVREFTVHVMFLIVCELVYNTPPVVCAAIIIATKKKKGKQTETRSTNCLRGETRNRKKKKGKKEKNTNMISRRRRPTLDALLLFFVSNFFLFQFPARVPYTEEDACDPLTIQSSRRYRQ